MILATCLGAQGLPLLAVHDICVGAQKSRGLAVHMSRVQAHKTSWAPKNLRDRPQDVMGVHTYRMAVQEPSSLGAHTITWLSAKLRGHPDDYMVAQRLRGRVWLSKTQDFPWTPI